MKKNNLVNVGLLMFVGCFLILGCKLPFKSSEITIVQSGCVTPDGSKIALTGHNSDYRFYTSSNIDKYRVILDGKTGKVIWKDFATDRLACAEDNSIISITDNEAKWVLEDKKISFTKPSENRSTNFIGMTDKNTIIREDRPFYAKKMESDNRGRTSSTRSYHNFPRFFVDKLGENETKVITLSESDLPDFSKEASFNYFFEKNLILIRSDKKMYAVDITNGKVVSNNLQDFQSSIVKTDKYDALETGREAPDGFIEIYEGKGDDAKVINKINKRDLSAKVIDIIDCCNNDLFLLYWERSTYVKVARIEHLTGKVVWKSDNLISKGNEK